MRILIVTGQLAKQSVEKHAFASSNETEVLALPVSVAALLTPSQIAAEIQKRKVRGFDLILVPGLVKGNLSVIEELSTIPVFKGPKYVADLPLVLKHINDITLSKSVPACELFKNELQQQALQALERVEQNRNTLLKKPGNVLVGNVAIGKAFPMRVMAEILDAPLLSDHDLLKQAAYYRESGAQIIDIGMIQGQSRPKDAERAVRVVKQSLNLPVSIDTFDLSEAKAAIRGGADILLSVDAGNVEEVAKLSSNIMVVVVPTNHREGYFPKGVSERVTALEENIKQSVELGIKNIIGDIILDPVNMPGIVESICAYKEFSQRNPEIPLLCGVGNVTELLDADTVGANALLAGIASELDVSILLTTEGSNKARGSVKELATASKLMFLAKKRNSAPIDLGLDLLLLKDKRLRDEPYDRQVDECTRVIRAKVFEEDYHDPKGVFKILVDRKEKRLVATRFVGKTQEEIIMGETAEEMIMTIVNMGFISSLSHAAYVGKELYKAEIALKTGKTFIQDEPLFNYDLKEG
ncbi:MAG: dihydropteroate synthase-like protein [Candidatus Bathyarchaeota archaeon]|nr:MAG: dihydropteroate synthase-like protein [Candidatus Bathyarchaeota archaeon]